MGKTHEVEFVKEDVTLEVPENKSILDAAEEMGMSPPYRCRRGICGVCCAKLLDGGDVDQSEGMFLSESEKDEGYVLTCIGKPCSDLKLETESSP
ncbi:2Fe-2S iron-sulfur cluster-binding protein [Natrinema soli]|uniref:2Fe-2S iron-sulfur cluster-binding protein n=1 Tax=Natrinema soli TaxID=1930624 RepID=A0ABD5SPF5_9EURY|nr:2Fe-2S iron-sulfur cluster-binding protein [Natrinema soli]